MSRNNKSARLTAERKQWAERRKSGSKGPSKTTPKKDKRFSYRSPPANVAKDRQEKLAAILGKTRSKPVLEQLKEGKIKQPKAKNLLTVEASLPEPLELLEALEDEALEAVVPRKPHGIVED